MSAQLFVIPDKTRDCYNADSAAFLDPRFRECDEMLPERKQGVAWMPCVVRDALSALLTMRHVIDGIETVLILRKPQSGCLEGRTALTLPLVNSFTRSFAGVTKQEDAPMPGISRRDEG